MRKEDKKSTVFYKLDPAEFIDEGAVVMVDPETLLVTKAVDDEHHINERFVAGICNVPSYVVTGLYYIQSPNSKETTKRQIISNRKADIIINGGNAKQQANLKVELQTNGITKVFVDGTVNTGERLVISKTPGYATSMNKHLIDGFNTRAIGKVLEPKADKYRCNVLLNIE